MVVLIVGKTCSDSMLAVKNSKNSLLKTCVQDVIMDRGNRNNPFAKL